MKIDAEAKRENRLVTRVPAQAQELIKVAADLCGSTVSQFLLDAAMDKARKTIETMSLFRLSQESADMMYEHLSNPTAPSNELCELMDNYSRRTNSDDTFTFNFTEQAKARP